MSLRQRIEDDLLVAIKSQNQLTRDVLRGLKSSLKNHEIELGTDQLPENEVEKIIAREVKRRKEAIEAYDTANKPELANTEKQELEILQVYLPTQLSEAAILSYVDKAFAQLGADATTGSVMGKLSGELRGQADMGIVARLVNQRLSK